MSGYIFSQKKEIRPAKRFEGRREVGPPGAFHRSPAVTAQGNSEHIVVDPARLRSWSLMFDDAGERLNGVGDTMYKINVKPGYFSEANMVRDLVKTFNGTFIPNSRVLADAALYIAQALRLVAEDFSQTEKVNLDRNNQLIDIISSLTKAESGLKTVQPVRPRT